MAGSVPAGPAYPVWHAVTFRQRLAGIHGVPAGHGVLLGCTSVHGRWLRHPIHLIWLDAAGTIVDRTMLRPGTEERCPGAAWALELPAEAVLPGLAGDAIVLVQSSAPCPGR